MSLTTLFYRKPRLVALMALTLIAAGASAFLAIGRQEDPTITNLFAIVKTVYPGADPERVESLVTRVIEDELESVAQVAELASSSSTGISIVNVELQQTLTDAQIETAWTDIRAALADAEQELPDSAQTPTFNNQGAGTYSVIVAITPDSDQDRVIAQRHAEELADVLRRIGGTDEVEIYGAQEEEVRVEVSPSMLASMGLTVDQLASAIGAADAKVSSGRLSGEASQYIIELDGEINAVSRIQAIPLRAADGRVSRVGDVAAVTQGVRNPGSEYSLVNGQDALLIAARVSEGLQVDTWMQSVRDRLADFDEALPLGMNLSVIFDQSAYTILRLKEVGVNMLIGVSLVVLVLLLTLGVRAALIVAVVLPLVTLASIATMNVFGLAIHQMSLTGLIVALGLLVDAAIVMTDEIRQALLRGASRRDAVGQSVNRLFSPLLASTITTALAFMPMALLPGPAGDFVGSIAIAVIIMLGWSFIIAITLTAALAGWILPMKDAPSARYSNGLTAAGINRRFRATLRWSLHYPLSAIALAMALPVLGLMSLPGLTAQFFPGVDRDQFYIDIELAEGSSINHTRSAVARIDAFLRSSEGINQVSWVIGRSAPAFYYNMVADRDQASQFAQALITTASTEATSRLVPSLQTTLDRNFPEARVVVRDLVQGPPVSAPVELRLVGPQLETLQQLGDELRIFLSNVDIITTVRTSLEAGAPKVQFRVNEDAARIAGLGLTDVARQLEATLDGAVGGSLVLGGESLPIRVRVPDEFRGDLEAIRELPIAPASRRIDPGEFDYDAVPLSAIANLTLVPAASTIPRLNGERINTVQGFVAYGILPQEALLAVQQELDASDFTLPPGYRLEFGGDSEERSNTVNNLVASLGIIVMLSFASIVLTFGSFRLTGITLVVSVLCAGLSLLSLAVFQYPFGINSIIGVIGSIGVSINAAIIILTGLQRAPQAAAGDIDAMVDVVAGSGRHIISTTVTTFGGFLPLILEGGGFWPPFAMSVAGGVLLSTIVSFYFTPPMFRLIYSGKPAPESPETATSTLCVADRTN